jgi:basic amino acid/polyamine antiporter, APA family
VLDSPPPAVEAPTALSHDSSLVRAIGVLGLAAGIVNVTVGGGIFRLPADVARGLGPAAPLAYVACAATMALIVLCFAEAGSRVDLTGGPYAYVETAFGPLVGFLAGVLLWITGTFATSAVAVVFTVNAAQLMPALGTRTGSALFLVIVLATLSAINVVGVREGTRMNVVFTAAKLLPLIALVIAGPFFVDPARLAWTQPPPAAAVAGTAALLIFAFAGIESALVPSGEVKEVARTIPRAVFFAMAVVTALYVALQLVAQGILGADLATSPTPLADTAGRMLGSTGRTLILAGAAVSMFGYVSGMTLAVPRALYAFARDGFLPRRLAAVHPRFHTPYVAIGVQAVVVCVLAISSTFERLALLANVNILVLYAACCAAAWQLRRRNVRAGGVPFAVRGGAVAPWLACLAIAWLLTGVTWAEWAALGATLVAAAAVFAMTARPLSSPPTSGTLG